MELDLLKPAARTEVGSYFVANYPPFSVWRREHVPAALAALGGKMLRSAQHDESERHDGGARPHAAPPLGLYLHVPFCRKRCKFCYFRVYTDRNSADVDAYMDALAREIETYRNFPALEGRQFEFVYFGGGTPSYLSSAQLERLVERIHRSRRWDAAREVTFECEPGTLQRGKLATIRRIGVTRLSLGIEHFDDEVLERNGRAHRSAEILRAFEWARAVGFDQINVDLIAGLVGDTEDRWHDAVERTLALDPDSVTIYQLELPHNTEFSRELRADGALAASVLRVADWDTKRRRVDAAFRRFESAGYFVSSAYTLVRGRAASSGVAADRGAFVYRDALWHGADMIGAGVASFSYVSGLHYQNYDQWDDYVGACRRGELPIARALPATPEQRLIRELVLQLKLGAVDAAYFRAKFDVEIRSRFSEALESLEREGYAEPSGGDGVRLTRAGLLRVDGLLPRFFEPEHRGVRYT